MFKIREVVKREDPVFGITIPQDIAILHENTYFKIESNGENILLISGTYRKVTMEEAKAYQFNEL